MVSYQNGTWIMKIWNTNDNIYLFILSEFYSSLNNRQTGLMRMPMFGENVLSFNNFDALYFRYLYIFVTIT